MSTKEIISINKTELAKISLEELEKRLKHEENCIQCWTCVLQGASCSPVYSGGGTWDCGADCGSDCDCDCDCY